MDNQEQIPQGYAEKVKRSKPGFTVEEDTAGTSQPEGLWRHPVSGAEMITVTDPLWGDGQSRAAVRAGFQYVGPAPEGSIKTVADADTSYHAQPQRDVEATQAYNKGVEARLNALEAERDALKAQLASGQQVPGTEPVMGADETKEAATAKVADQTGVKVDPATGGEAKPKDESDNLPSLNELRAMARDLGVSGGGSKEELAERVAAARAEKEKK